MENYEKSSTDLSKRNTVSLSAITGPSKKRMSVLEKPSDQSIITNANQNDTTTERALQLEPTKFSASGIDISDD